jgi:multiple sugar transport system permease protein
MATIPATVPIRSHRRRQLRGGIRQAFGTAAVVVIGAVVLVWVLFPFYWAILNSIKAPVDAIGWKWIPFVDFDPTLGTWRRILAIREVRQALQNSATIALGGATVALLLGTPAAYAIARFRFGRVRNTSLMAWFFSQRVMPPVIFVPPIFLIIRELGLLDSVWALVLLNGTFNLPFPVIILSQMFREVPVELEEAAQVDGASRLQIFLRIALPLVAPGLVVSWLIALAFCWNELLFALVVANQHAIPLPVIIAGTAGTRGIDFQGASTLALFALLPPMVVALLAQRYIVRGLSFGAVRG